VIAEFHTILVLPHWRYGVATSNMSSGWDFLILRCLASRYASTPLTVVITGLLVELAYPL